MWETTKLCGKPRLAAKTCTLRPISLVGSPGIPTEDTDKELTLVFFGYINCPDICQVVMSNLSSAMSGAKTPQQALDDTAAAWEQVTDRLGRDKQLKAYQEAIGWQG